MLAAEIESLEKVRFDREQAIALLSLFGGGRETATKGDVHQVELKVEQVKGDVDLKVEQIKSGVELKIEQVEKNLLVKIERVKSELLFWFVGIAFGQSAFLWYVLKGSTQ
jgi:DNA/RNA endonuclease YhcR with UshA esterase domain